MAAETQVFLDEAKSHRAIGDATPAVPDTVGSQTAVCTVPYLNLGLRAWWKRSGEALEEMARQERLLLDAIATEADLSYRARLENQLMNVRTVQRVGSEMQRYAREFQQTYRQWIDQDDLLREAAETLNYTV